MTKAGSSTQLSIDNIGLKKLVYKLKTEHRVLIDLAYFKGYTHEEIAEIESLPLGTVKNKNKKCINTIERIYKVNIQDYISGGIVESYVLGLASNEERLEFEQLCATHAELRQAREAFEISLEQHALDNAVAPPAGLQQKIWNDINLGTVSAPTVNVQPAANNTARTMQQLAPVRSMGFAKMMAAASIILLAGSTILNFYFYNQYKSSVAKLDEYVASNQQMASNNAVMQTKLQQYETALDIIKDTNTAIIALKGQPVAPQSATTVYWNKQTKDVYLLVNGLPQPAAGKQYQLWAIVDGVPVDAGMLDMTAANGVIKMKNTPKAQAFAITLENTGGSKIPTMPIYVVGKT